VTQCVQLGLLFMSVGYSNNNNNNNINIMFTANNTLQEAQL